MRHPPPEVVHRIHDRYLVEIVEELGLCPFARRSREQGRVHRPLLWVDDDKPSARDAAGELAKVAVEHPDAEIVLLTFLDDDGAFSRFGEPSVFEELVAEVREAYASMDGPHFFMVAFHPGLGDGARAPTKDSLVPLIRRSPDPVIQCVNARVLEEARAHAQQTAHRRLVESLTKRDPMLAAMVENSVQADSELSADIARHNFDAVGRGAGRDELERRLADIARDRHEAYQAHGS